MSEEQKVQEEAPKPSEIEVAAQEHGWRPKEEFDADPKNAGKTWRSAEDFMDRKSFFDRIEASNAEIRSLKGTLKQLADHNTKIEKKAYEQALADLRAERAAARQDGDFAKVDEIREKMEEVQEKIREVRPPVTVQEVPPAVVAFKARNTWYQKDPRLTRYADTLGAELIQQGMSPDAMLLEVEREVRETFPDKFRNPNRDSAPEMGTSGRKASSVKRDGFVPTEEEQKVARTFAKTGIMTEDAYYEQLKKMRG